MPFWRDRENIELGKTVGQYLLLAFLALFAWFAVLRPLLRKHLAPPAPPVAEATCTEAATAPAGGRGTQDLARRSPAPARSPRQKADMDYAHHIADQDPKLVATLIQHWMNANDQ